MSVFFLMYREPKPDAEYWPGRCWLAAADALAWPGLLIAWALQWPRPGVFVPVLVSVAALLALRRLYRAVWLNHRYWFTTWRFAKLLGGMVFIFLVMKTVFWWQGIH